MMLKEDGNDTQMDNLKTIAVNVAIAAVIAILLIWGNTLYRQHAQFEKGEKGYAAGNFPEAVAGYESAIHMYTPGAPLTEKSARKLWEMAQMLERKGDYTRALIAYRSLRSSFYAIVWIYQPGQDWIARCDQRIAELVKREQGR